MKCEKCGGWYPIDISLHKRCYPSRCLFTSAVASGREVRVVTYRDGQTAASDVVSRLMFRTQEDAERAAKLLARLGDGRLFCSICDDAVEDDQARWHMDEEHHDRLSYNEAKRNEEMSNEEAIAQWFVG